MVHYTISCIIWVNEKDGQKNENNIIFISNAHHILSSES